MVESKIKEIRKQNGFPKLMHSDQGLVVLFEEPGKGVVVSGNENYKVGCILLSWKMHLFEDFPNEVVLKNK